MSAKIQFSIPGRTEPDYCRPVAITTKRSILLRPIGEEIRHADAGERLTITMGDLAMLEPGDYEIPGEP